MNRALEQQVWERARSFCEYCRFSSQYAEAPFQVDHIVAQKHGGESVPENLALSCYNCNSYKGPNIAGIDPVSGKMVRLFNPGVIGGQTTSFGRVPYLPDGRQ
jgi:hypothetical protein